MTAPAAPEFSRPFALERLGHDTLTQRLVANPAERAALAARFDLLALDRLEAEVTLRWTAGGVLRLTGRLQASATQPCVVTLEPVRQEIDEPFELRYSRHAAEEAEPGEEEGLDPDAPEPLPEAGLDLGEEVAQALSLALDPYPRAPGAALAEAEEPAVGHPFAALKRLKDPG